MPRQYSFKYRRRNPDQFPYVCDTCVPQRRFLLPRDKKYHDESKRHQDGILIAATSNVFEYSSPGSLPRFGLSASTTSLSSITAEELNLYVRKEIEPDKNYNKKCNAMVDQLCKFMLNSFPKKLRPSEIRKCGSLGKGTAVKGKSDADLVVFLAKLSTMSDFLKHSEDILNQMKVYLKKHPKCHVVDTTLHAVQVSFSCHGHDHSADILPSVDILAKNTKQYIYAEMESLHKDSRKYYSAALAPLQIEFVSGVPTKVKTLIRLLKYWRKTEFQESSGKQKLPSSYILELIVIGKWGDAGKPENFNLCIGFYNVLNAIAHYERLKYAWTVNYNFNYISDPYYVVDPANPFNNVMETACNCWNMVAEKAKQFLESPLFRGLSESNEWV